MKMLTSFPSQQACEQAIALLNELSLAWEFIAAAPAYSQVSVGALVLEEEARSALLASGRYQMNDCGWVACDEQLPAVPATPAREFDEDIVGRIVIVVLAPCVVEGDRLRVIAHLSGDLGEALPYLNAELLQGSFVPGIPVLTYMDGRHIVSLFRDRIAIAKATDIVDAWAILEQARVRLNDPGRAAPA